MQDYGSDQQPQKQKANEDLDILHYQLKACKAENEQLWTHISKQNAEMESLQNQLQAERLRYQKFRDFLHKLQISYEIFIKEATQDDKLKRNEIRPGRAQFQGMDYPRVMADKNKSHVQCTCGTATEKELTKFDELESHLLNLVYYVNKLRQQSLVKGTPTIEIIKAPKETNVDQSVASSQEESDNRKLLSHLAADGRHPTHPTEVMRQLQEENEHSETVLNQLKTENASLRKELEDARKAVHESTDDESEYEKIKTELKTVNQLLQEKIEDARGKQHYHSAKVINQMGEEDETLRKQLEEARRMAQSSQEQIKFEETRHRKIISQLEEENDFLKHRLESLTNIASRASSTKEVVVYMEKPVEITKTDTDNDKTINELRNLNESLQNELKDAITVRKELEEQIKKLKDATEVLTIHQTEQITAVDGKSSENDVSQLMEQNESLKRQVDDCLIITALQDHGDGEYLQM